MARVKNFIGEQKAKRYAQRHTCYATDAHLQRMATQKTFLAGYKQAVKDTALTWEQAQQVFILTHQVMEEFNRTLSFSSTQEMYEEVLRRYNEIEWI